MSQTYQTIQMPSPEVTEQRLVRMQSMAGILFFTFLALHLSNLPLALFGPRAFNDYQALLRIFYQQPVVELVFVLGPIVVHLVAGVWLIFLRRAKRKGVVRPLKSRLHSWAGIFLMLVIVGHVIAVRGPSFFYDVFPLFEGLSFSLWYFPAYFYPYYFLLALAGLYHGLFGLMIVLNRIGITKKRIRVPVLSYYVGAIIIVASLLALDGSFFTVPPQTESEFGILYAEGLNLDINSPWK
jgi:succinate dehydrogenase/fumarate reductase cytochrome b subunit